MIPFLHPQILWFLWILPPLFGLLFWAAGRRRAALSRLADARLLPGLVPPVSATRSWLRSGLLGGAVASFIVALGGPWWGFHWEEISRRGVDVVVALDLSRSMLAQDLKPDRLSAAKREVKDLLGLLQGDRLGLVVFSGVAFIQVPLTLDYNALELFIDGLDTDTVPIGGTNLADAVTKSTEAFAASDRAGRAVLLITDGEDHSGELKAAADGARREGVHVYVVGLGDPAGAPMPNGEGGFIEEDGKIVLSKLGEAELMELALTTDGAYVRGQAGDLDLRGLYLDGIRGHLESKEQGSSRKRREEERFQWPLALGILLLLMESLLSPVRRPGKTLAVVLLLALPRPAQAGWWPNWFGGQDVISEGHDRFAAGDFQGAKDAWVKAQVDHPADRRLDYDVGMAQYRLGEFAEAEESFARAAETDQQGLAADASYNAGDAAFQQGKFQEAIARYDQSLTLRPGDEDATKNRDLAQRRYEEMLEEAKKQQQERKEEQEKKDDAQADGQSPPQEEPGEGQEGEEGEQGEQGQQQQQEQQQQQGSGRSEQEAKDPGEGEGQEQGTPDDAAAQGESGDEGKEKDAPEQGQQGGEAAAADIDREGQGGETPEGDGVVASQTEESPTGDAAGAARAIRPGALTKAQAEALLDALKRDQQQRQKERTQREAKKGRRAAGKDW